MAGVNKVILVGRLGNDREVRSLPSGATVVNFSVATSDSWTNKNGEKVEQTEWHRIEMWDQLAKTAEQYLKKGDMVYVEGKLRTEKWTDKDGTERTTIRVRGLGMQLLGGKSGGQASNDMVESPAQNYAAAPKPAPMPAAPSFSNGGGGEDDLPF